ncbi:chemotaxis protein CheD [Haladaptatus sp. T7]|uniref:chemotaxis protein CheD n=1 Tax=Haladaptatus sp. T7 TaxID=2029368 RepID=UPI0021A251A2|nr:chemotaxis protein CheD [Haladaptatus sp. T7]GKZ12495.1 putative chemoreceptor glutamine deamidase CheD 3 [Haladaptatus sp. T7]
MKVYRSDSKRGGSGPIKVGVAEYAVTEAETRLTTTGLGSCLGIALSEPTSGVAGLAHAMLPSTADSDGNEAKFVDTAINGMLTEMEDAGANMETVEAKIAGGSNMLELSGIGSDVGTRNVEAAEALLADERIPIVGEDTGGDYGRSLEFDTRTSVLVVKSAHRGVKRI